MAWHQSEDCYIDRLRVEVGSRMTVVGWTSESRGWNMFDLSRSFTHDYSRLDLFIKVNTAVLVGQTDASTITEFELVQLTLVTRALFCLIPAAPIRSEHLCSSLS